MAPKNHNRVKYSIWLNRDMKKVADTERDLRSANGQSISTSDIIREAIALGLRRPCNGIDSIEVREDVSSD
jgi:hypothetical protein